MSATVTVSVAFDMEVEEASVAFGRLVHSLRDRVVLNVMKRTTSRTASAIYKSAQQLRLLKKRCQVVCLLKKLDDLCSNQPC